MKKILFRVDSSSKIGLGHVMRCLTLAQRLKTQGVNVSFAVQDLVGNINEKIISSGFNIHVLNTNEVDELIALINVLKIDLLILDSYEFDYNYEKKVYDKKLCKILAFDDLLTSHCSHFVLNHGPHINKDHYQGLLNDGTQLLCGEEATILRDEFFRTYKSEIHKNSIALLLGGNDALNLLPTLIDQLVSIGFFQITVITSKSNQNIELIKNKGVELKLDISNIAEELASKDFVICSTSAVLFEVIALKKRFININVAQNQNSLATFLADKNIQTTLNISELSEENLKKKIKYIFRNNIYDQLQMKFSQVKLRDKIIEELI